MKRNPLILALAAALSVGCMPTAGAQAPMKLSLTRNAATPSAQAIFESMGGEPSWHSRKGWPFNGKNRAQRARLANGSAATR